MKKGFTLVEMLIVIGIIAIITAAAVGGFSSALGKADKARGQELVSNVATALASLYNTDGQWPKVVLRNGQTDGRLDENVAIVLAKRGLLSLTYDDVKLKLTGHDRFGVITPWAFDEVKKRGTGASLGTRVGTATVQDHILHYAVDADGDGVVEANVGGEALKIRTTAAVWSVGKEGGDNGNPWPYRTGRRKGDIYSWADGQTKSVQ